MGIIIPVIGIPTLLLQRRQTRIAEALQRIDVSRVYVDQLQRMRANKQLRIEYLHYPPFSFAPLANSDPPTRFYMNLIRRVCDSEGITPVFELIIFSSALSAILKDELDIVLPIFQTPRRSRMADFSVFLHSVSVSGVTRYQEDRISSPYDLVTLPLKFVVCREEIGHEILEEHFKIPLKQIIIVDTSNIADIIEMVAAKKADVAIADSLYCRRGLAERGAKGPKLRFILHRRPLYLCPNGIMIAKGQHPLAERLDRELKSLLNEVEFQKAEEDIIEEFCGIIVKM